LRNLHEWLGLLATTSKSKTDTAMTTKKTEQTKKLRPIIFDDEPFNVLVSLAGSGGIRGVDDEKLGDNFSCFVLKTNLWYGLPKWDKGDPEQGKVPQSDFWTQLLFVPTEGIKADNKLYSKVSDRTVCQMFKRGRHLNTFSAACKTTRNEVKLDDLLDELNIPELQAWQLVVWTPEFVGKSNKHGNYSALKWEWSMPEGERQLETQSRIIKMYQEFGTNPIELEYEIDPGLLNLDTLEPEEKRKFKKLIASQNQPILLGEAAQAFAALPQQIEQAAIKAEADSSAGSK